MDIKVIKKYLIVVQQLILAVNSVKQKFCGLYNEFFIVSLKWQWSC